MHGFGGVVRKQNHTRTTFKQKMQNDGFESTTAGQNIEILIVQLSNGCPKFKNKFLNCNDGKGEDDVENLNEASVHQSQGFRNIRFKPNQGIPKLVSSRSLEETINNPLEEPIKRCDENRASGKMYHSLSKP